MTSIMDPTLLLLLFDFLVCVYAQPQRPNFVVIFADDFGYGDLHSYGHPTQEKGAIDQLAAEGLRFTQWYSAESICTPSRAALLTGRLPIRNGIFGPRRVFWPMDVGGLPKNETTIAEALKELGYATGMVGKWHLGINEFEEGDGNHLPHHHGFEYVGSSLPFTLHWPCDPEKFSVEEMSKYCFLYDNSTLVQQPINPTTLTKKLTNEAVSFINLHATDPFFLYLPMPQTHVAMICSPEFCNKSKRGIYGDNVNELAWAVGEVINTVRKLRLETKTMVLFVSDHGPHVEMCFDGGSSGLLRGGKFTSWEGGIRVPAIAWWPGTIPAGEVSSEVVSTLDVFPTLVKLAGGNISSGNIIDGVALDDVLIGKHRPGVDATKHEILFHYCSDQIMAVRFGRYKVHFYTHRTSYNVSNCVNGKPLVFVLHDFNCSATTARDPPLMYDLEADPGELYPLDSSQHEDVLSRVKQLIHEHKQSVVPVKSQLHSLNNELQPCCNPPTCQCNYPEDHFSTKIREEL